MYKNHKSNEQSSISGYRIKQNWQNKDNTINITCSSCAILCSIHLTKPSETFLFLKLDKKKPKQYEGFIRET